MVLCQLTTVPVVSMLMVRQNIIKNATTNLADTRNEAKAEIDTKLAEHKKAIEAKRDEAFSKIDDDISLRAEQRQAAKDAVAAAAGML